MSDLNLQHLLEWASWVSVAAACVILATIGSMDVVDRLPDSWVRPAVLTVSVLLAIGLVLLLVGHEEEQNSRGP